jgi:hypothetical protein
MTLGPNVRLLLAARARRSWPPRPVAAVASQQIGRELGVRYVVEGSVRSSDNRVGGSEAFERMVF